MKFQTILHYNKSIEINRFAFPFVLSELTTKCKIRFIIALLPNYYQISLPYTHFYAGRLYYTNVVHTYVLLLYATRVLCDVRKNKQDKRHHQEVCAHTIDSTLT